MSVPQTLYLAEQYVVSRLTDATTGFNYQITQTAPAYGVTPFQLTTTSTPPTLYLGRYDANDIRKAGGATASWNVPFAILSIAKGDATGKQAMRVTPSIFSGLVIVTIDFVVGYPTGSLPPDGNAMFCAIADAMLETMNMQASVNVPPPGIGYNNEMALDQGVMEFDGSRWVLVVPTTILMNLIV